MATDWGRKRTPETKTGGTSQGSQQHLGSVQSDREKILGGNTRPDTNPNTPGVAPIRRRSSVPFIGEEVSNVQDNIISYGQQLQSEWEPQSLTPEQQKAEGKVEGGITGFFKSLFRGVGELIRLSVKSLFSGILAAALLPFFGPIVAIGVCKSQDSAGEIGTVIWVDKRSESTDFRLENDPQNDINSSRRILGFTP